MTNPQVQNDPVYTLPVLNVRGLIVSNNATTPNTKLDISAGTARDSNNIMDITLGAANPNLQGNTVTAPLTVNAGTTGANALDTGTLGASHVYAVYVIADSKGYNSTAGIVSLSLSGPTMPFGYDSYRLIGYAVTDGSSHFLAAYISGNGVERVYTFDAPIATAVTAGAATSYTAVDLTNFVPLVDQTPVNLTYNFTANAAADTLKLQGANSTGDAFILTAAVAGATAHATGLVQILAQTKSAKPEINYVVSTASAAVALNVAGFIFYV